ncbi:YitT family protein [Barrientosiimonas marina]|uniref:YitT family protein n=1 Tax=Lentibacillus kimchii TaxID=1542911 RepID=A0ABW2UWT7_9BACI
MKQTTKDLLLIIIGSFIFAISVNFFIIPNHLSEGGVIGVSIVAHYLFNWPSGVVNFVLNAILVVIGYRFFDKRFTAYTVTAIILSSIFLDLTASWGYKINDDTLLAALFAGLGIGLGLGLIFRTGGTSSGSSILARMGNRLFGWTIGQGMLFIDIAVIAGSAFIIGQERAMYTLVAVYIEAKIIDMVVEGANERTAAIIISSYPDHVLDAVTQKMSRGITVLEGKGGYTNAQQDVLYLVINKQEIVPFRRIITDIDPDAYVTVHPVQEIFRTGYKGR